MNMMPFDNFITQQFFSGYLINHYLYKMSILSNTIEKYDKLKPDLFEDVEDVVDADVVKSLRLEIRATYFQAIETLFEMIFSLEPRSSVIDNRYLWYFLSNSRWRKNYKRIELIAKGDTGFLDRQITVGSGNTFPFIQYLFYFGLRNPEVLDSVNASLESIKKFIVKYAEEFTDRNEYNAFKHSLRILPTFQKVEISPNENEKPLVTIDMSHTMTHLIKNDGTIFLRTKSLDSTRDARMGAVCSLLISNIVKSRKMHFAKESGGHLYLFSNESFSLANEHTVKWADFKLSIKLINESTTTEI